MTRPDGAIRAGAGLRKVSRPPEKEVRKRYAAEDTAVFTPDEASRFIPRGAGDPQADVVLAWELLYRLEPELYDRLASAERLHRGVVDWLPRGVDRIAEVGAGTGRLTLDLIEHGRHVVAVEPALPLRRILQAKVAAAGLADRVDVVHGFFDRLPLPDNFADLVVACSALTPSPGHGGETGLAQMERVCRPGGSVVIIWPNHVSWLTARGYRYVSVPGPMFVEFGSHHEAVELAEIFYPAAADQIRSRGWRKVPFEALGINPPRDLAFKRLAA